MHELHLKKFIRPLIHKNQDDNYHYSSSGSCFLVHFLCHYLHYDGYYLVAAKHSFENSNYRYNSATVPIYSDSISPHSPHLPLKQVCYYPQEEHEDSSDIVIFEVDTQQLSDEIIQFLCENSFKLDSSLAQEFLNFDEDTKFIVIGFPNSENNTIDYDSKRINMQPVALSAKYTGPSKNIEYSSEIELLDNDDFLKQIGDFNGLSGSPVLVGINHEAKIAGILLRATKSSRIGYFVNSYVLFIQLSLCSFMINEQRAKSER